jgi:recombination protein RecA
MARPKKVRDEQFKETDSSFLDAIVEKFGDNVLSNIRGDSVQAMSSGSLSLDASIGIGGFPKGRFTHIYGSEGTGKTTLALTTSMKEIEAGGKVLYIDAENMLSFGTIEQMLGNPVDRDKFILLQPETANQAFMIVEKGITSGEFTLIIVDTIASLAPDDEKEKEFDENTMGSLSRTLTKFFRRNASDVKIANVCVLLLNQVRDDLKSYMGGFKAPGGHALAHYSSVIVALTKGTEIKQGEDKIGINSRFVIKKNKMGPPFRSFEIPIIFGKGVDYYTDTISFCEILGILKKSGAFYKFEGETIGQGRNNTAQFLRDNPETLARLEEMLYNQINKQSTGVVILEESEEEVES